MRWEYTVTPQFHTRRLVCLSDKVEYRDLIDAYDGTSAWYFTPKGGVNASTKDAFEVVQFTENREERPIRRAERTAGRLCSASLGQTAPDTALRLSYTYRTVTAERNHLLHNDFKQLMRGIEVALDYGDTDIERVSVLDLIASSKASRVKSTLDAVPERAVRVSFDGWAFPRSGVGFVWAGTTKRHHLSLIRINETPVKNRS